MSNYKSIVYEAAGLDIFKELPEDLFFELFSYLDPVDLLHFSRTTKTLHAYLSSKEANSLWIQVIQTFLERISALEKPCSLFGIFRRTLTFGLRHWTKTTLKTACVTRLSCMASTVRLVVPFLWIFVYN